MQCGIRLEDGAAEHASRHARDCAERIRREAIQIVLNVILVIVAIIIGASVIGWALEKIGLGVIDVVEKQRNNASNEAYCNDCEYFDVDPMNLPCRDCMQGRGQYDRFKMREDR